MVWNPASDELVVGDLPLKMEVLLFSANALVTCLVMLIVSLCVPMRSDERDRAEAFHTRIATPIGQLEEDLADTTAAGAVFSPFGVVGISVLIIGLMMLAVLPWIADPLAFRLDVGLGSALSVIGALVTWKSRGESEPR